MKKIIAVILLLLSVCTVQAAMPVRTKMNSMPEGIFKKTRNGKIIQYNSKGKKIGIYELSGGRYVKII